MHLIQVPETRPSVITLEELIEQRGGLQNFVDELMLQTEGDNTPSTICMYANTMKEIGISAHGCFQRRHVSWPQNLATRTRL